MHIRSVPSFFLTNKTGAPQGEKLGLMNPRSNNSCNWIFNSLSSAGAILYGALDTGSVPGANSITKSISRDGGKPGKSAGKTSTNSRTRRVSPGLDGTAEVMSTTLAKKPMHPSRKRSLAFNAEIKGTRGPYAVPTKTNGSSPTGANVTILRLQSMVAPYLDNQSMPSIISYSSIASSIKSTVNTLPSISTGKALTHL